MKYSPFSSDTVPSRRPSTRMLTPASGSFFSPRTVPASLPVVPAMAGTTGKLAGTVRGEKKEPLAGVNIRVEGLRLGTVSDEKGEYFILGVPAGVYVVRANLMGYAPFVAEKV